MSTPLIESIPAEVLAQIAGLRAVQVGFGAGPGCVAVNIKKLDPSTPLESAMAWLEGYRGTFRRGHVEVCGGARLFFDPNGFLRLAAPGQP